MFFLFFSLQDCRKNLNCIFFLFFPFKLAGTTSVIFFCFLFFPVKLAETTSNGFSFVLLPFKFAGTTSMTFFVSFSYRLSLQKQRQMAFHSYCFPSGFQEQLQWAFISFISLPSSWQEERHSRLLCFSFSPFKLAGTTSVFFLLLPYQFFHGESRNPLTTPFTVTMNATLFPAVRILIKSIQVRAEPKPLHFFSLFATGIGKPTKHIRSINVYIQVAPWVRSLPSYWRTSLGCYLYRAVNSDQLTSPSQIPNSTASCLLHNNNSACKYINRSPVSSYPHTSIYHRVSITLTNLFFVF